MLLRCASSSGQQRPTPPAPVARQAGLIDRPCALVGWPLRLRATVGPSQRVACPGTSGSARTPPRPLLLLLLRSRRRVACGAAAPSDGGAARSASPTASAAVSVDLATTADAVDAAAAAAAAAAAGGSGVQPAAPSDGGSASNGSSSTSGSWTNSSSNKSSSGISVANSIRSNGTSSSVSSSSSSSSSSSNSNSNKATSSSSSNVAANSSAAASEGPAHSHKPKGAAAPWGARGPDDFGVTLKELQQLVAAAVDRRGALPPLPERLLQAPSGGGSGGDGADAATAAAAAADAAASALCAALRTSPARGIPDGDAADAAARAAAFGANRLPDAATSSLWRLLADAASDATMVMLMAAGGLSLALTAAARGDAADYIDGAAILASVAICVGFAAGTNYSKEAKFRRLNAAKDDVRVRALRGGREAGASAFGVLVGDVLAVEAGDILPADGLLLPGSGELR